ncbi:MAG: hypothetical protein K0A90_03770 [Methanosarcinaceae archaeon]|nr:hypothetical protein [Methanosarcinaceae archaeon]
MMGVSKLKTPQKSIFYDQSGWIDFTLSKIAMIIASVIIVAAVFQLAADFKDMGRENELGVIALDLKSAVDNVGSDTFDAGVVRTYSFDMERFSFDNRFEINAYISGEYVRMTATANDGRIIHAVKPLTFRVLPFNESTLRSELVDRFGHDGTVDDPITSDYTMIVDFLSQMSANEIMLNTSMPDYIQKTFIYTIPIIDTGVNKIDYVLVYQ